MFFFGSRILIHPHVEGDLIPIQWWRERRVELVDG